MINVFVCSNEDSDPVSQKSAGHMQNRKTKTNTNLSPDPNRYRSRSPDPNARIQKFINYMAIAIFAIADCHPNERIGRSGVLRGEGLGDPYRV